MSRGSLSLGFGANIAIVSEFSHKNIRDMVMMFVMSFKCVSAVVIVLITWAMLTQRWQFSLVDGAFELHTWSFYLYACGIWGLLASIQYYFLPESPKFLLTHGDTQGALGVLKCIYSENTGQHVDTFPIRSLNEDIGSRVTEPEKATFTDRLLGGLSEMKALGRKPLLFYLLTFTTISFMVMFAYNTLRLWFPQISTILETYKEEHGRTEAFCVMIDGYMLDISHTNKSSLSETETEICVPVSEHLSRFRGRGDDNTKKASFQRLNKRIMKCRYLRKV
ncbi:Synaptic vesicle glycoprotein 2C [Eumeta japonica]|uniref:Synaptic vesicle glycoprotein 2C n=1 Tax=Eumeta variegata TaxID=151549 RepID=A0A4C1TNP0_EUMVA|nr:Synaptic vesicle glycoprotein 2C [Eumeta japonica]